MVIKKVPAAKRLHYFTGQLLVDDDFTAEQDYHVGGSRRHASTLHTWGVIAGLDVVQQGEHEIGVTAGTAIDASGRQIVLQSGERLAVEPAATLTAYVVVSAAEGAEDVDRSTEEENYTRTTEYTVLQIGPDAPALDGSVVQLAKLQLDASGRIASIDTSVRRSAGSLIAPASVGNPHLADGTVTLPKLHATLRSGWIRMPFKPSFFDESGAGAKSFLIGVTKARCDAQGAKGTMAIPVPAGANRLKTFVLAGMRNSGQLNIELWRCGWNNKKNQADAEQLLPADKTKIRGAPFNLRVPIDKPLDSETNAVAVYVEAVGESEINLVAAEFEWSV
ncbi:conserved hypothetical protein [Candidatus Sulfopaludibacter sp. SbA3]|nr:conserved hypothetical protein [Candidatus Sulfopaludibacter sp. SbA3]